MMICFYDGEYEKVRHQKVFPLK